MWEGMRGTGKLRFEATWIQKQTQEEKEWKFGECSSGIENIIVLDGGCNMVVKSCLLNVDGRMSLKSVWKLVPQMGGG